MTREEMEIYLGHFNNKRYDAAARYFADDVAVHYPNDFIFGAASGKILHGSTQFINNYKSLHEKIDETVDLEDFIADNRYIFVALHTEFTAKQDMLWSAGPLEKGQTAVVSDFVLYEVDDEGKFKSIRIAHHNITYPGGNLIRHA